MKESDRRAQEVVDCALSIQQFTRSIPITPSGDDTPRYRDPRIRETRLDKVLYALRIRTRPLLTEREYVLALDMVFAEHKWQHQLMMASELRNPIWVTHGEKAAIKGEGVKD